MPSSLTGVEGHLSLVTPFQQTSVMRERRKKEGKEVTGSPLGSRAIFVYFIVFLFGL